MKVLEWSQQTPPPPPLKVYTDFYDAQGELTPQSDVGSILFKFIQDFMVVLVTCKNEEDPIKNEGARVVVTLSIIFKMLKDSLLHNR